MTDPGRRANLAATAARAGGEEALSAFRTDPSVETKGHKNDLVTAADRAAQGVVEGRIGDAFPDDPVVGEEGEGPKAVPAAGPAWVVDPIDGTANYVRGMRLWTTSVAAVVDGDPVGAASVMPATGDAYAAGTEECRRNGDPVAVSDWTDPETFAVALLGFGPPADRGGHPPLAESLLDRVGDLRRLGSMQTGLAFVASGELDAAVATRRQEPWDAVAGAHLVARAGGTVTDVDGRPWHHDSDSLVVSNGRAHGAIREAASEARRADRV